MEPLQLATQIAKALDAKKATDVKVLKVHDLTVMADYFVIASGNSSTQVRALADEVEFKLAEQGVRPTQKEGEKSRGWIVLDYGSVIAHVFYPEDREFYALERLWADAEQVQVNL